MSEIHFTGEDEHGEPITFDCWKELAEAQPWSLIDQSSLSNAQLEFLIAEMQPHTGTLAVEHGDEQVQMAPDGFDPNTPALRRFAANNLPRLQPQSARDMLAIAGGEAAAFLERELDGFHGLSRTFVRKRRKKWHAVALERGKPQPCERLIDLFVLNLAPRLSPLWHAIRILVTADEARRAMACGDMLGTANASVTVGESRKALALKLVRSDVGASGGRQSSPEIATRNEELRDEAAKLRQERPCLSETAIAQILKRRRGLGISDRAITGIIKVGSEGA